MTFIFNTNSIQPTEGSGGGGTINNQNKTVTPSKNDQSITADTGYTGLGTVTVKGDDDLVTNNIKSGVNIFGVVGNVVEANNTTTNITPSTSSQTVIPESPYNGFSSVTVPAVTSSIDTNISANNIVSGITILGVQGTAVELDGEQVTITPSTSQQIITPITGNGITQATVSAVTNSIDNNITAENIKKDVTILGVTGTYDAGGGDINIITAKNNTSATISSGNKVWICKDSGDNAFYLRSFTYANEYSYTGFATSSGTDGADISVETLLPDIITITLSTTENDVYLSVR